MAAARALGSFVLLATMQVLAKATWIEIQQQPPPSVIAGEVLPPGIQPRVALWNHRGVVDIFGRFVPASVGFQYASACSRTACALRGGFEGCSLSHHASGVGCA